MARAHLAFTLLMLAGLEDIRGNNLHSGSSNVKPYLDPKRRSEILNETFLEQKDILLDMLETKLKEVRDKKKKLARNGIDGNKTNSTNSFEIQNKPCDKHLENVDLKLKVNGISAVGDANLTLKYGTGKGSVNLEASGISNIGKVHVELGVGETALFIPGLTNLFVDRAHVNCTNHNVLTEAKEHPDNSRRIGNDADLNVTSTNVAAENVTIYNTITTAEVTNSTVQVGNSPGNSSSETTTQGTTNSTAVDIPANTNVS